MSYMLLRIRELGLEMINSLEGALECVHSIVFINVNKKWE